MTQTAIGHHYEAEYDIAKKVVDNFIKKYFNYASIFANLSSYLSTQKQYNYRTMCGCSVTAARKSSGPECQLPI